MVGNRLENLGNVGGKPLMVRVVQKHHCYICTALLAFVYVNRYFYTISRGEENIVILAF